MIFVVAAFADITGTVYRDLPVDGDTLNTYGVRDANEPGVRGVTVRAYDAGGNLAAQAVTGADGRYTLQTVPGSYRVEFGGWPGYLQESPDASGSATSVQFVDDGSDGVDLGLHDPQDYTSTENPDIATTVFISGRHDDTGGPQETVLSSSYDAQANDAIRAKKTDTGSIWGLAYDPAKKLLYSAAMLRRYSDLGPAGLGGVYVTDENGNTQLFVDVSNDEDVGSVTRTADDIKSYNEPTHDVDAFGKIGKVGLGDIDLTPDGKSLFVTNLNTRHILEYDTQSKNLLRTYTLPDTICQASGATLRPFAVKYHNGALYSGAVCDTSDASHPLSAHVFKWNGSSFEEVVNADLSYYHEPAAKAQPSSTQSGILGNCPTGWIRRRPRVPGSSKIWTMIKVPGSKVGRAM